MIVKQIFTGGDRNYGYVAGDREGGEGIIVDPSYNPELLWEISQKLGLKIKYIFCTHNHYDHTNGNDRIKVLTGLKPIIYNAPPGFTDGITVPLGELNVKIIHTPGHTPDCMCIYTGNAVFTGDTLFVGKIGGTSGRDNARVQYKAIHDKLMTLPADTIVYPGHNYGVEPFSSIKKEKETNPFILQPDFEAFFYLKNNWAQYKIEHGIK